MNRLYLIFLVVFLGGMIFAENSREGYVHPRLLLTSENLSEYQTKAVSTHARLFEMTMAQADEFCARTIPEFRNASNTYREIGDAGNIYVDDAAFYLVPVLPSDHTKAVGERVLHTNDVH